MSRASGIDALYQLGSFQLPVVWPHMASLEGCRATIAGTEAVPTPFFAVHRRALLRLDPRATAVLGDFWAERGLFASPRAARQFIPPIGGASRRRS